ncbi:MAG: RNA polymerase sigma-70 factor [Saprospiraceae bacterium]
MANQIEKNLVQDLKKGNVHSFDELFKSFNKKIYYFSLSYLKSKEEAEDIVQEVFLSLWKNRANLNIQADFQAYLFTITFNAIKKRFRKFERERKHLEAYFPSVRLNDNDSDAATAYDLLNELLKESLEQLPPRQKEIFLLSKEGGLTAEEIAEKLKISKRTVENHLFRAKSFLKNILVDERLLTILFFWIIVK